MTQPEPRDEVPAPRSARDAEPTAAGHVQESAAHDGPTYSSAHPDSRDPQAVGNVLNGFIAQRGWRTELGLRSILTRWAELVGPVNAQHCQPEAFRDGVLKVRAESTTWATAMRGMAPQLLAKLNSELGDGAVKHIDVQGPAAPSWKHGIRSVRDGRGPRDTYG